VLALSGVFYNRDSSSEGLIEFIGGKEEMDTFKGTQSRATVEALMALEEETWTAWDIIFDGLDERGWFRRHGKDWVFADVPYHLAYIERDVVANNIILGSSLPESSRLELRTTADLNKWNEKKFSERPFGQRATESLVQSRKARDAIRHAMAGLSDADLQRPAWSITPPTRGWRTVRFLLTWDIMHNWTELITMRTYTHINFPVLSPELNHTAMSMMMRMMPSFVNRNQAKDHELSVLMQFTDPGVGTWNLDIDGKVLTCEEFDKKANLVMKLRSDTFVRMSGGLINPMLAMLNGSIQVQGLRYMPVFGRLMTPPQPNQVIAPIE
jgi:putative sterol carrier protein